MDALIAEQNRTLNAKLKVRQYMQQTGQFCHIQHNFNTLCTSNNSLVWQYDYTIEFSSLL